MTRLLGGKPALVEANVKDFFDRRANLASKANEFASTTFANEEDAAARHQQEARLILPLLGLPSPHAHILDAGCGAGRWAATFFEEPTTAPASYLGFDFSQPLIDLGSSRGLGDRASFVGASTFEFINGPYCDGRSFSHALIIAAAMYMNDNTLNDLLNFIAKKLIPGGLLYLREGMMTNGERLTLVEEPSAALVDNYSVIYRTADEYSDMIKRAGLTLYQSGDLPGAHFQRHAETRHSYFVGQLS